jgi:hypothetical protein
MQTFKLTFSIVKPRLSHGKWLVLYFRTNSGWEVTKIFLAWGADTHFEFKWDDNLQIGKGQNCGNALDYAVAIANTYSNAPLALRNVQFGTENDYDLLIHLLQLFSKVCLILIVTNMQMLKHLFV